MSKNTENPTEILQSSAVFLQGLQRYEVMEQIGVGGMGKVYKAFDKHLKRNVALKVSIGDMDGKNASRFLHEVEAMAQLQHPNIVPLYEIGQVQNHPFFSMELIEGNGLREILKKKKRLPAKQAAELMLKIVLAIDYAHKKNVIHRDLKPENIMLRPNGEPMIMDFGIAKIATSQTRLTKTGTSLGTLSYMSPEQANGIPSEMDHRSDIYSLGCILYEMLAGKVPLVVANQTELLMKIFEEMPPRISQHKVRVSPAIEAICLKALSKNKSTRYQTAEEMAMDLQRYLNNEPVLAQLPHLGTYLIAWLQRNRKVIVGNLVAAILSLLIYHFVFQQGETSIPSKNDNQIKNETSNASQSNDCLENKNEKKVHPANIHPNPVSSTIQNPHANPTPANYSNFNPNLAENQKKSDSLSALILKSQRRVSAEDGNSFNPKLASLEYWNNLKNFAFQGIHLPKQRWDTIIKKIAIFEKKLKSRHLDNFEYIELSEFFNEIERVDLGLECMSAIRNPDLPELLKRIQYYKKLRLYGRVRYNWDILRKEFPEEVREIEEYRQFLKESPLIEPHTQPSLKQIFHTISYAIAHNWEVRHNQDLLDMLDYCFVQIQYADPPMLAWVLQASKSMLLMKYGYWKESKAAIDAIQGEYERLFTLAIYHFYSKNFSKSLEIFSNINKICQKDSCYQEEGGIRAKYIGYLEKHNPSEDLPTWAEEYFDKSLTHFFTIFQYQALMNIDQLIHTKQNGVAINVLNDFSFLDGGNFIHLFHYKLGMILDTLPSQEEHLKLAIHLNYFPEGLFMLSQFYFHIKSHQLTEKYLQHTLLNISESKLDQGDVFSIHLLHQIGECYRQNSQLKRSLECIQKCRTSIPEKMPDDENKKLEYIHLFLKIAKSYYHLRELDKSIECLETCREKIPETLLHKEEYRQIYDSIQENLQNLKKRKE